MTFRKTALFAALAGVALACSAPPPAEAQGRPLTIKKRGAPALTPGRYVAPGSRATWATASADAAPVWSFDARFRGNLPERNFMPGRPQPLFVFSTPRM